MSIPPELAQYIIDYGYWAVFSLIFVQELGIPNPVPNEMILLFAGYLAYTKILSFPIIFIAGVSADFIGTTILYAIFYFFGDWIIRHAPRWLPVHKIEGIKQKLRKNSGRNIFIGRLLPYLRGYASVAAGLLKISPQKFLPSVIGSAILWTGGYIIAGRLLGKQWNKLTETLSFWQITLILIALVLFFFYGVPKIINFLKNLKIKKINVNKI